MVRPRSDQFNYILGSSMHRWELQKVQLTSVVRRNDSYLIVVNREVVNESRAANLHIHIQFRLVRCICVNCAVNAGRLINCSEF